MLSKARRRQRGGACTSPEMAMLPLCGASDTGWTRYSHITQSGGAWADGSEESATRRKGSPQPLGPPWSRVASWHCRSQEGHSGTRRSLSLWDMSRANEGAFYQPRAQTRAVSGWGRSGRRRAVSPMASWREAASRW